MNSLRSLSEYALIIFDLDGTIAPSKCPIDHEMADLLLQLLSRTKVAIISGAGFPQFHIQVLQSLPISSNSFTNLFLMPTSGTRMYVWRGTWNEQYTEQLSPAEKQRVITSLTQTLNQTGFGPSSLKTYGEQIEDRGTQISYSALGQSAPLDKRLTWDTDKTKRSKIVDVLQPKIPEFDLRIGGTTTIDITKRGINKAYGVRKLEEYLKISPDKILFIGDALYHGGNDFPAKATGVDCLQISGPEETKQFLHQLLAL